MDSLPDTQLVAIIAFAAGMLSSMLGVAIATCAGHKKPEPVVDVKELFKKLPLLPPETEDDDDTDDFQEYLAERLATSQAFRLKMVQGMARLHNNHPKVYSEVMRR
jgi:hypothetical protein